LFVHEVESRYSLKFKKQLPENLFRMWKKITGFVFGEPLPDHIPERISRSITEHSIASEILIGWVQIIIVLFFASLYTIAPKTSQATTFAPVPWALGVYGVFSVVRLVLAYRRFIPWGGMMFSIFMDMGLLMFLIWSFHLQYQQPAPFYLKAPTLLYVFIFISLRALRFEAKYVVAAGLAAAAGWLLLLFLALEDMVGMNEAITRDYVLYMTSNRVLIGAEIDKVISILVVTSLLAVALVRARRLLIRSVLDGMTAQDLSRFVSPEVAKRIVNSDRSMQAGDGEVKIATAMFTDIEGFSTISERLEPGQLMTLLNEYLGLMAKTVDQFGGVISQFIGDGILVTFNAANIDKDHAANAIRAALEIQKKLVDYEFSNGIRLKTRCGINTGEFVVGAVGTENRLLFTIHGDDVNIAARLEQLNKEYATYILAGENTVLGAGDEFSFRELGQVVVKGRSSPTKVFTVEGAPALETPSRMGGDVGA
jgi:adenylate cyclase